MTDPYMLRCGHSFDKHNIEKVIEKYKNCPVCRTPATKDDLFPNFSLKGMIQSKVNKNKN